MNDAGWRHVVETNLASCVACTRGAIERCRQWMRPFGCRWPHPGMIATLEPARPTHSIAN